LVYSNAEPAGAVSGQGFEAIARGSPEILELPGGIEHIQFTQGNHLYRRKTPRFPRLKKSFGVGVLVLETSYHYHTAYRRKFNVKR